MSSASEDTGFETAWAVGDFAICDLSQQRQAVSADLSRRQQVPGKQLPGRKNVLTCTCEADLTRLFPVKGCGVCGRCPDEIIRQQSCP